LIFLQIFKEYYVNNAIELLVGLCPGPSLVQFGASNLVASVFVPSMLVGMAGQELISK
jgi:hypothetical protein